MDNVKNKALESAPKVKKEQIPSDNETSKEILYGGDKKWSEGQIKYYQKCNQWVGSARKNTI